MRIRTLVAAAAAPLALGTMLLTTAGAASADTSPGTTGPGSFQFLTFDPSWNYTDGIQTTGGGAPSTQYQIKVLPPLNAPGQPPAALSAKLRTIPVKYVVESRTSTPGSTTVYPDTLRSDFSAFKTVSNPNPTGTISTNLLWNAPDGVTVSQVTSLVADFAWQQGQNAAGSMRWQINTSAGDVYVYYGEPFNTGAGTVDSGVNMITDPTNTSRVEWQGHSPMYDTWSNVLARTSGAGTLGQEKVNWIGLVTDSGYTGDQQVKVSDISITTAAGTSTYTPGTVTTDPSVTAWAADNSQPAYLYLAKDGSQITESTLTDTQGSTGGQFRAVDGMYIYNLPMSQLTDLNAKYQVGISFNTDGSGPVDGSVVGFGLR